MVGRNRVKGAPVPGFTPEGATRRNRAATPLFDASRDIVEKAYRYGLSGKSESLL
jgi:hypothetical protein